MTKIVKYIIKARFSYVDLFFLLALSKFLFAGDYQTAFIVFAVWVAVATFCKILADELDQREGK